jgi:hypothetical protein
MLLDDRPCSAFQIVFMLAHNGEESFVRVSDSTGYATHMEMVNHGERMVACSYHVCLSKELPRCPFRPDRRFCFCRAGVINSVVISRRLVHKEGAISHWVVE